MGNHFRHQGILLDEADFDLPPDCDMDTVAQAVEAFLAAEFRDAYETPFLGMIAVVSEGLDQTTACCLDGGRGLWIRPETNFEDIFVGVASGLGIPAALTVDTLKTACTDRIEAYVERRIGQSVRDRCYDDTKLLLDELSGLRSSGIPGVKAPGEFDTSCEDKIVNFRINNYGPGRRILAEIVFGGG